MAPNDNSQIDFAVARAQLMLSLRQNVITDHALLNAVESVPHEYFLPAEHRHFAYSEADLQLGEGEQRWTPLTIARILSHLDVEKKHKVLIIGTGSGYMSAIVARLCRRIFTLERARLFLQDAELIWTHLRIINITPMQEDGLNGWPLDVSFDRIVLCGGVDAIPEKVLAQLSDNGILIAPMLENKSAEDDEAAQPCTLLKILRTRDNFHEQNIGDLATTMLKKGIVRAS